MSSLVKSDQHIESHESKMHKTKSTSSNADQQKGSVDDVNLKDDDANNDSNVDKSESAQEDLQQKAKRKLLNFLRVYNFPILILIAIALAKAYPPLGAVYLAPQITATWIAVMIMFLYSGIGLKTKEFMSSLSKMHFNAFVQFYNFMICSSVVFGITRILVRTNALDQALIEGMVVCSCLPMALNTAIVLTVAAGGDEAAAVFNTLIGNVIGIFLSPALILLYIGKAGSISLPQVVMSLAIRVIVPLVVGQLLQQFVPPVKNFFIKHRFVFGKINEYCLVYIVYTVFCRTFLSQSKTSAGNILLMVLFQFILMSILLTLAWFTLMVVFRNQPELRIMGVFGGTHKTIALGIPLITTLFKGSPDIGLYSLPVLIWHPMALILGSLIVPYLKKFKAAEDERLNSKGIDATVEDPENPDVKNASNDGIDNGDGYKTDVSERDADVEAFGASKIGAQNVMHEHDIVQNKEFGVDSTN